MDESSTTSLSYLIPTDGMDIAVRELLIPIFGDAIRCKIPGEVCAAGPGLVGDSGSLVASLISVFNGGTMIFATIMLIFIGILGFVKTANDGEFFGRSWNTTFTALRLVAGIAFLLPMPNNYSTIQNFVLYVGLWSSGAANQANVAASEHYLFRLHKNLSNQERGATTVESEAQMALGLHACASLINKRYGPQGAKLTYQRSMNEGITEFAYVEQGTYLTRGIAPCGRLVVPALDDVQSKVEVDSGVPTDGVWNGALWATPLTASARKAIMASAQGVAENARASKLSAIDSLMKETSPLRGVADQLVDHFERGQVQYNEDGSIKSKGDPTANFHADFVKGYVATYASIVRNTDRKIEEDMNRYRTEVLQGGGSQFFTQTKDMLQKGGWMSAAATYRTMLDMVSIRFTGQHQSPYQMKGRDVGYAAVATPSPGGMSEKLWTLNNINERIFASDVVTRQIQNAMPTSYQYRLATPPMNAERAEKAAQATSFDGALKDVYGQSWLNGFRDGVMRSMTISSDYDPLYQVKAIGDLATVTAEVLVGAEFAARAAVALAKVGVAWGTGNIVGRAVNVVSGAGNAAEAGISGAQYVFEQVFVMMKVLSTAMIAIGYMFSTWLPAVPYMAFLLAQVGWLLGLVMTLFAVNIWAVLHLTPAQNDSFIGSQSQGYLLITGLFFRPMIAVCALSLSFVIAPPLMKLVNITLLPAMFTANVSTNTLSVVTATIFNLILYFAIAKAVLLMVYMLPQSFPDEILRFIGAGVGDLGASKGMQTMEASEGSSRVAIQSLQGMDRASGESFKGKIKADVDAGKLRKAELDAMAGGGNGGGAGGRQT